MAKIVGYKAKVWNQEAKFGTIGEAKRYIQKMLSIYDNTGINVALIKWEIKPIYK